MPRDGVQAPKVVVPQELRRTLLLSLSSSSRMACILPMSSPALSSWAESSSWRFTACMHCVCDLRVNNLNVRVRVCIVCVHVCTVHFACVAYVRVDMSSLMCKLVYVLACMHALSRGERCCWGVDADPPVRA